MFSRPGTVEQFSFVRLCNGNGRTCKRSARLCLFLGGVCERMYARCCMTQPIVLSMLHWMLHRTASCVIKLYLGLKKYIAGYALCSVPLGCISLLLPRLPINAIQLVQAIWAAMKKYKLYCKICIVFCTFSVFVTECFTECFMKCLIECYHKSYQTAALFVVIYLHKLHLINFSHFIQVSCYT